MTSPRDRAAPAGKREKDAIIAYMEDQAHEKVTHVEKAASELVGPVRYDIWDVHCAASRWWVVTNPMNLSSAKPTLTAMSNGTQHSGAP